MVWVLSAGNSVWRNCTPGPKHKSNSGAAVLVRPVPWRTACPWSYAGQWAGTQEGQPRWASGTGWATRLWLSKGPSPSSHWYVGMYSRMLAAQQSDGRPSQWSSSHFREIWNKVGAKRNAARSSWATFCLLSCVHSLVMHSNRARRSVIWKSLVWVLPSETTTKVIISFFF